MKNKVPIKISGKWFKNKWHPCTVDFIQNVCHAACGCVHYKKDGFVPVFPDEEEYLQRKGAYIVDGIIRFINLNNGYKVCPFYDFDTCFCRLHTDEKGGTKPLSCKISPFKLTINNILVIQKRFIHIPCFNADGAMPAYDAYRWQLELLFDDVDRIICEIKNDKDNIIGEVTQDMFERLVVRRGIMSQQYKLKKNIRLSSDKVNRVSARKFSDKRE